MESICKFTIKSDYENYANTTDILAHVITNTEDKVYLKLGRLYSFCIHADFHVGSTKNVLILGNDCTLSKIAKVKITNIDTNESRIINPTRLVEFEEGDYKIDYGIYINSDQETYSTPKYIFEICPEVIYILVDPIVKTVHKTSITSCDNLTGIMFGEPDLYPETLVFTLPYSHNDVIVNNHMTIDNSGRGGVFLMNCKKVGNIYIGDLVKGFTSCFGVNNSCLNANRVGDKSCETYSNTKSEIYLGENVQSVLFSNQNKINRCIVSLNNSYIEYDAAVNGVIKKLLNSAGKKVILTGLGSGYPNGYLKIPSGYTFGNGYTTYSGLTDIKIIDLSEYDTQGTCSDGVTGITFTGFRDLYVETLILPTNVHFVSDYVSGFPYVKNLIVPAKLAPIVAWHGDWQEWYGHRNSIYDYCFNDISNCYGALGSSVNKAQRNLYVLDGTEDEKASWTEQYDRTKISSWKATDTPDSDDYDRPNMWGDLIKDYNDPGTDHVKWPSESTSPYKAYKLNYKEEYGDNGMRALINSFIPEGYNKLPTDVLTQDLN